MLGLVVGVVVVLVISNALLLMAAIRAFWWIRVSARLGVPVAFRDTRSLIEVWEILHGQDTTP